MSYDEIGDFSGQYKFVDGLDVGRLRGGFIESKEIVLAGGTKGVIRSQDFVTGASGSGWAIMGDGSAEFNNVTVRGTIVAGTSSSVDWSYIANVSITNADITSLSFSKITAATNTASLVIGSGGTLASSNYSAGSAGFQIAGTGSAEFNNVTVRGSLYGTYAQWYDSTVGIIIDPSDFGTGTTPTITFDVNSSTLDPQIWAASSTKALTMQGGNSGSGSASLILTPTYFTMNGPGTTYFTGLSNVFHIYKAMDFHSNGVAATGPLTGVTNISMSGSLSTPTSISASGLISTTNYLRATGTGSASNNQVQLGAATTGFYNSGGVINFTSGGTSVGVFGTGYFGPSSDNTRGCGASGARWTSVWAVNGTIQTSDLTRKNVLDEPVPGLDFVNKLKPIKFQWKEGWDSEHVHWGLGAQDVQKLIGNEGPLRADEPDNLGMNYAEIVPALVVAVQELSAKLENHVCGSAE